MYSVYVPHYAYPYARTDPRPFKFNVNGVACNLVTVVHESPMSLTLVHYDKLFGVVQPVYFEVMRSEVFE